MALRVTFALQESTFDAASSIRNAQTTFERTESSPNPNVRVTFVLGENIFDTSTRRLITTGVLLEYVIAVGPFEGKTKSELIMQTAPYPALIGLSWPVHQKPTFSTNVQVHTSGRETRTAYYEQPLWDFELSYDYLPDDLLDSKDTDYKHIVGFFLDCKGPFDTFLYFNTNDRQINAGFLGTGDGTTIQFLFAKQWGTHLEPVGFVDQGNPISVWVERSDSLVIASNTATVAHPTNISKVVSVKIGATTLTLTTGAPGVNEYSVSAGVFTFNASRNGATVVIDYQYLATGGGVEYGVVLPNEIVFTTAPPVGATITGTFGYAYVCRFKDDVADIDQFMDKLYEFNQVNLRSIIL